MTEAQSGFAEVNGARLYYEVAGAGQPLVLIHAGICDSRMWDEHVPIFAQHFQVVRYDMRGFGRSPMPDGPFAHRDDLRALLHTLGVAQAHVLGVSMGGKVALEFTLEHPEMVTALVLVAAALSGIEMSELWAQRDAAIEQATDDGDFDRAVDLELQLWVDGPTRTPEQVDATVRERVRTMNRTIYANYNPQGLPQPLDTPLVERLGEIHAPTLVIVGQHDVPDFQEYGALLADSILGARLVEFPDTAHLPPMEQPEVFARVVQGFLA